MILTHDPNEIPGGRVHLFTHSSKQKGCNQALQGLLGSDTDPCTNHYGLAKPELHISPPEQAAWGQPLLNYWLCVKERVSPGGNQDGGTRREKGRQASNASKSTTVFVINLLLAH